VAGAVTQTRTFVYDDASRLTSADNPESGTIAYEYDDNGNLTSKTDARGIETNYSYDGLNRVIKRTYTAPSPAPDAYSATSDALYYYDGKGLSSAPAYSLGKLTKVANDESETQYTGFDVAGRITESKQITDGLAVCTGTSSACKMSYQYNLAGMLTEETYPSGRIVHHNFGADGKLTAVSSRLAVNKPLKSYAQNFSYNAAGAVTDLQLGNMRWEHTEFNARMQPTKIALGTTAGDDDMLNLVYGYGTTANNGNVLSQTIKVENVGATQGFEVVQTYTYDEVNRLKSATEMTTPNSGGSATLSWKQTYSFDRFGNRRFDTSSGATTTIPGGCSTAVCNPTFNLANNRFAGSQGYDYDSAGNLTDDANGKKFAYDAENKQQSFGTGGLSTGGGAYVYDGDGRRVKKTVGTEVTICVYDAAARMVAEYTSTAPSAPLVNYLTVDTLGTPRINTDAAGAVIARHDYMPFGEEVPTRGNRVSGLGYGSDTIRQKFTKKERDVETGIDHFGARTYTADLGRFSGADNVNYSKTVDPQTWNQYVYCRNGPLVRIDPDGHNWFLLTQNGVQSWVWFDTDTYTYTEYYRDRQGRTQSRLRRVYSPWRQLLVVSVNPQAEANGTHRATVTLYGSGYQDVRAQDTYAFSGMPGAGHQPLSAGTYFINMTRVGGPETNAPTSDGQLASFHDGFQIIGSNHPVWRGSWGSMRANLSSAAWVDDQPVYKFGNGTEYYLHGHWNSSPEHISRPYDLTKGCVGTPNEGVLNWLAKYGAT
jgi:RHS repeat-associated protein